MPCVKAMEIIWERSAESKLEDIWLFIAKDSVRYADKTIYEIENLVKRLTDNPYQGQEEGNLIRYKLGHRYLIHTHYKIIYRVFEDKIFISAIFDTRQRPSKLKRVVKKG